MPILGVIASSKLTASPTAFESIATYTVTGSNVNDITFSSIPSTYQHLQIRYMGKDTRNDSSHGNPMYFQFNGDTGSNYGLHYIYSDGSSGVAGGSVSDTSVVAYSITTTTANADNYAGAIIDILEYKNTTKYKVVRSLGGFAQQSGNTSVFITTGAWRNTNAITSIKFYSNGFQLKPNTTIALYGIKGA